MTTRRRKMRFTAAREARRRAREGVGAPPASRVMADKRRKPPRHKKKILEEQLFD